MKAAARAIVIKDDQILVMERLKMGKTYYTLLGGGVEQGESPDQTILREVREESTIELKDPRLVFVEEAGDPFGTQYVYLCEYVSGDPSLPPESEEAFWSKEGVNTYTPIWLPLAKLSEVPFVSPLLKEALLMGLEHGWPNEPYHFSSKHSHRLS